MNERLKKFDPKELELPDTTFIRDIDNRVFQSIAAQCLEKIAGVSLIENNLIDNLLGREATERMRGISVDQDQKHHCVKLRVEVNVAYGVSLPEKAEEIQTLVAKEVGRLTGLRVASVHVVFKNLMAKEIEDLPTSN